MHLSASELSLAERSLYQKDLGLRYSLNVTPEDTEMDSKIPPKLHMAKPKVYLSASELSLAEHSLYQRDLGPRYSPNGIPEDD